MNQKQQIHVFLNRHLQITPEPQAHLKLTLTNTNAAYLYQKHTTPTGGAWERVVHPSETLELGVQLDTSTTDLDKILAAFYLPEATDFQINLTTGKAVLDLDTGKLPAHCTNLNAVLTWLELMARIFPGFIGFFPFNMPFFIQEPVEDLALAMPKSGQDYFTYPVEEMFNRTWGSNKEIFTTVTRQLGAPGFCRMVEMMEWFTTDEWEQFLQETSTRLVYELIVTNVPWVLLQDLLPYKHLWDYTTRKNLLQSLTTAGGESVLLAFGQELKRLKTPQSLKGSFKNMHELYEHVKNLPDSAWHLEARDS